MKKILSVLLAMIVLAVSIPNMGLYTDAGNETSSASVVSSDASLRTTVEEQIRAYAKSINQSGADSAAAKALANHGLTGRGKKLSVGKNHALTATLWNSELLQVAAIETCTATIEYMQELDQDYLPYVNGGCIWKSEGHSSYGAAVYTADDIEPEHCVVSFWGSRQYTGTRNTYDSSLDWMVGTTGVKISFQVKKVTADSITYSVTYSIWDRFDFSTSSNSNFKNLISVVGAILFREFDWESKVTFELTVPYSCIHNSGKYHWSYDPESHLLISDSTDGYTENKTIQHTVTSESGQIQYYHKLEKTIRLRHDKPWVMEYTTRKPGNFVIAPLEVFSRQQLLFSHCGNVALMLRQRSDDEYNNYDYYGIQYDKQPSGNGTYTFRLENVIDAQGNNMIYLTIINADSQAVVLSKSPMDGYYEFVDSVWILKSSPSDYLNGIDLFVNYIGNYNNRFHADYFDLRIWENGIDGGDGDYFTSKVTAPTCTTRGYTTHTCTCCGYSYKDSYTKAAHTYGDWVVTTPSTHTESGVETRTCACGAAETREIPKLEAPLGDINGDGIADSADLTALRAYLCGIDTGVAEKNLDVNGDGAVNMRDVAMLAIMLGGLSATE